jgi:hypothetical protein
MALENILMELGAKLDANTAAIKAAIASGALSLKAPPVDPAAARDPAPEDAVTEAAEKTTRGRGRPPKEQAKKYSPDEVAAAAAKVKEELGVDKAKALIAEYAGAGKKLADIPEAKFGAFIAAAEALIVAAASADAEEEPDEEDL